MLRMKSNNRIALEQPSTTTSTNDLHSFHLLILISSRKAPEQWFLTWVWSDPWGSFRVLIEVSELQKFSKRLDFINSYLSKQKNHQLHGSYFSNIPVIGISKDSA